MPKFNYEEHQKRMREILTPKPKFNIAQSLVSKFRKLPIRKISGK